jgi:DNA-binding response OmpR family regulator
MSRILIVDDEPKIVQIFTTFLSKMGFEVMPAHGGEEAVAFLRSGARADLMIVDMKMPKVTGLDVLRLRHELGLTMPVIIVTGSMSQEKGYKQLEALGFSPGDIIYKPVDLFLLLAEVKKHLAKVQA